MSNYTAVCHLGSWIPPLLQRQDVPSPEDIATELRKTGHVEPGCGKYYVIDVVTRRGFWR